VAESAVAVFVGTEFELMAGHGENSCPPPGKAPCEEIVFNMEDVSDSRLSLNMKTPSVVLLLPQLKFKFICLTFCRMAAAASAYSNASHSHQSGEENGMEYFTSWFKEHLPGILIEFIPTTDRLWTL
jgi:hypothetical protein